MHIRSTLTTIAKSKKTMKEAESNMRRQERLQRKRVVEERKRAEAAECTKGLPRSLVPTNLPDKYGFKSDCKQAGICLNTHIIARFTHPIPMIVLTGECRGTWPRQQ